MPNGHEFLAEELHAVHLGLDATSSVVAAPPAPDGPAEELYGTQGLVPRPRAGAEHVSDSDIVGMVLIGAGLLAIDGRVLDFGRRRSANSNMAIGR